MDNQELNLAALKIQSSEIHSSSSSSSSSSSEINSNESEIPPPIPKLPSDDIVNKLVGRIHKIRQSRDSSAGDLRMRQSRGKSAVINSPHIDGTIRKLSSPQFRSNSGM